jgi:muramoyltetrapeptide carboxypeptidase
VVRRARLPVKLGEHALDRDDYVAGDERERAADLMAMFTDLEVDVVQSLQGGYGSAQTIPHLDFELIAQNAKPFVGYSDITALHVAIRHIREERSPRLSPAAASGS